MKKCRKALSLLMVLTMILVNFTVSADGNATDVWDGTYDFDWFLENLYASEELHITTPEQFAAIGAIGRGIDRDIHGIAPDHLGTKTFILDNDIYLNDFVYEETLAFEENLNPWVSVAQANITLDGNGHTVYGLYLAPDMTCSNYGLIDELQGKGAIKNITFSNAFLHCTQERDAGVAAGVNRGGILENITVTNSHFFAEGGRIAGIIGENSYAEGIVSNCKVIDSEFMATAGCIAGIAVKNYSEATVRDCYVDITIKADTSAAGIVMENCATVDNCIADAVITNYSEGGMCGTVGGIVAASKQRDGKLCVVKNCISRAKISAPSFAPVGGIVGETEACAIIENNLVISDSIENPFAEWCSASATVGNLMHSSIMENNLAIVPVARTGIINGNGGYTEEGVDSIYISNCYYKGNATALYGDSSKGVIENCDYLDDNFLTVSGQEDVVVLLNNWVADKGDGYNTWVMGENGPEFAAETEPEVTYVAEVDGIQYETLAAAVEAAADGVTVTLLGDAAGTGVVVDKNITIDFGGYTYTLTEGIGSTGTETNGLQLLAGNNVTLKNGTLEVAEESKDLFYILVQNYANLTVENMNLDGTNLDRYSTTDGDSYVLSNNSGTVNITGATNITANDEGDLAFAFDACKYGSYDAPVVNVSTTGKVTGAIEVTGGNLAISGGTYTVAIDETWCADGFVPVANEDGTYGVEKQNLVSVYCYQNGEVAVEFGYDNLADALNDAADLKEMSEADSVVVKLNGDVETNTTLVINCDITLDLGGYTVTGVRSAEGEYIDAFTILANVTVTGGTVDASASGYTFYVGSDEKAGNLTILDGDYRGEVTVVNVRKGSVNIEGGYFQATEYNGDYRYTINCIDANYNNGTATVEINGGTFYGFNPSDNLAEGNGTVFTADGYNGVANSNGTYSVELISISITDDKVVTTGVSSAAVVLASYSGTRLVDVQYVEITANADIVIADTGLDTTGATSISAMLLKDIANIMPLCKNVSQ